MKVALVHDYLIEYGGAEKVLEDLHDLFPKAPVFTAFYDPIELGPNAYRFKDWDIRTSWIQKIPGAKRFISPFRLLAPMAFESFDLTDYNLVISSCNIYFAKAVITAPGSLHISYIHTPPRYLYGFTTTFNYKKHWWVRFSAEIANHILRLFDFETSQRPDLLVANSENVAKRIKKFYRRDAQVIYPAVDIDRFKKSKKVKGDYFLSLGRLWRSKGLDIIIKACSEGNFQLKVVGVGSELNNLKKLAGSSVEFLGSVTEDQKIKLYAGARALVAAEEDVDFGLTVIEAMAAGTPVIALRSGGYLETVLEGKTGQFYDQLTTESLKKVLVAFDPDKYKEQDCRKQAEKFSKKRFESQILALTAEGKS